MHKFIVWPCMGYFLESFFFNFLCGNKILLRRQKFDAPFCTLGCSDDKALFAIFENGHKAANQVNFYKF